MCEIQELLRSNVNTHIKCDACGNWLKPVNWYFPEHLADSARVCEASGKQTPMFAFAREREHLEKTFRRYLKIAFVDPDITTGRFLEHGKVTGRVLVASEGCRKSVQVIPDQPDTRCGLGW